jgi:DNA topoisomerase-1
MQFEFKAKSGVRQTVVLEDARLAKAVRRCQDLPGQLLFQYVDDMGEIRSITSSDVNAYLQQIAGDSFTAKDFRTWAGTLAAARALDALGTAESKTACAKAIVNAVDRVAKELGNTRAVCRKCYIHPVVFERYEAGVTIGAITPRGRVPRGLLAPEAALLTLLKTRRRRPAESLKP